MVQRTEFHGWPQGFNPGESPVYVHNEIEIKADRERVWELLVAAPQWSQWYANAFFVRIRQPAGGTKLALGTVFSWAPFLYPLRSVIVGFDVDRLMEWDFHGWHMRGYHVWLITPTPGGCRVVTEEVEIGAFPRTLRWVLNPLMWANHKVWVRGLRRAAEQSHRTAARSAQGGSSFASESA